LGAFLIGRYLLRGVVEKRLGARPEFVKLERAAQKDGWKIVALARLSPVFPFLVGNYAFGSTSIPALHYCGASVLGTIPSASVYTYLGTLFESISALGARSHQRSWQEWLFLIAGLLATVWLSYYLKCFAQNVLSEKIK